MKRLLSFLKPHWWYFGYLVGLNFALAGASVIPPLVIKDIIDLVLLAGSYGMLAQYIFIILAVALFRSVGLYFYQYGKEVLGQKVLTTVRTTLYRKFLGLPYGYYDTAQTGQLMSRITNDVEATRLFLASSLVEVINLCMTIIWVSVTFTLQNLLMAVLCLIPLGIFAFFLNSLQRRLGSVWNQVHQTSAGLSTVLQENLAGYRIVKSFAREEDEEERFRVVNEESRVANYKTAKSWTGVQTLFIFSGRAIQLLVLGIGGYLVVNGRMGLGGLAASLGLVRMLVNPIMQLSNQVNTFSRSLVGALRVFEVLDEPCPIQSPENPVSPKEILGEIEFRRVTFGYQGKEQEALDALSIRITAGSCVGLIGQTGSGKSTLINLLGRFYDPKEGQILVDGVDIKALRLDFLRRNIAYVSQEPLLFSIPIKDNIAYGNPQATMEGIIAAAKLAQAHEFIMELPEGYETKLGERGIGLSGGQKQRLAIARAFLTNPKILILDDCTSALDAKVAAELQKAVNAIMNGRTTIIVSSKISTVQGADKIIVLQDGKVVQEGTHRELLANDGYYSNIYSLQTKSMASGEEEAG